MAGIWELFFEHYVNQPASLGLAVLAIGYAHITIDNMRWKTHDDEAKNFRATSLKNFDIIKKVETYLMKFETDEMKAKDKRIEHIICVAKNSTAIIIQKYQNYFLNKTNLDKIEDRIYQDILEITVEHMNNTWTRLSGEGFQYEVTLMKETSELLMPKYAEEIRFICHLYKSEGLNGTKIETIKRCLVSFEQLVVNSWDKYFRKLAYS